MIIRNQFVLRSIASFLLLTILIEVFFPTITYALTAGPTTPEVYGHQPADATDNVSLVTGDFNYTIPITSIPEYPMAVGYSGQAGMDQEAGIFGYGINGFSGAIARSTQGMPDDLNAAGRVYDYVNQYNWSASVEGTISAGIASAGAVGLSANASLLVGYDNYKGMFGAVSVGLGLSVKIPGILVNRGGLGLGIGAGLSSAYGWYGNAGISAGKFSYGVGGSFSEKKFSQGLILSLSASDFTKAKDDESGAMNFDLGSMLTSMGNLGVQSFSSQSQTSAGLLSPLPSVVATTKGFGVSLTVPITPNISVTGAFNSYNYGNKNETKNAYGFMYLNNYDRSNRANIADFALEGESAYNHIALNNPSYLQRDFFVVNSQGFAGSMQLYQQEYGVVSRNYDRYQNRDLGLMGMNTERKETEQWTGANRAVINKRLDILKLLKKKEEEDDKDFDNTIFVEEPLVNMNTPEYRFGAAKFKMRGDLAGEFNASSANSTDFKPNSYEIRHISGTGGGSKLSFLKEEKEMPVYYVKPTDETLDKYNNANNVMSASSNITHSTLGQVVDAYSSTMPTDPLLSTDNTTKNNFIESFLCHNTRSGSATSKIQSDSLVGGQISNFSIIQHLKNKRANGKTSINDVIADIRVRNTDGLTYIYNLPAFAKTTKTLLLSGKGKNAPKSNTSDYYSFDQGGEKNRNKSTVTEDYEYPYAWMLTAMVGADYIDFDGIPGPSEGDLGYWVKFKYVKVADDYKWRFPYTNLSHNPLAIHSNEDDIYSATMGTKEIYYVSEIESSNYTSKYIYYKRFDGLDAGGNGMFNGDAYNSLNQTKAIPADPTGSNSQYAVHRVELYKKHHEGDNSSVRKLVNRQGKLIRATVFHYDYSICPNTPNNVTNYSGKQVAIGSQKVRYHIKYSDANTTNVGTGKLTLRKVQHISYEGTSPAKLPSYELKYGFDFSTEAEMNPAYDEQQTDQWGNFSKNAKYQATTSTGLINYYNSYTEIDKLQADKNAQAFKLSKVYLPGGGSLGVNFEANSYGKVQDKTPFVMRKVLPTITADGVTVNVGGAIYQACKVWVDITDLNYDGKKLDSLYKFDATRDIFGELAFFESNKPANSFPSVADQVFVSGMPARIASFGLTTVSGGKTYQEITIYDPNSAGEVPFVQKFKQYLYNESTKAKVIKETIIGCDIAPALAKYENLDKDDPLTALRKMISNVVKYFKSESDFTTKFDNCFGPTFTTVLDNASFIRTPVYKAKYTGSRVKSIAFADNFKYATKSDGTLMSSAAGQQRENVYKTNYFYDVNGNGAGVSEGVATMEPGGGPSAVIDINSLKGAGYMPGPSIMSAKTTVETGYASATSRPKGSVEYHFYTAKDQDYRFADNFSQTDVTQGPGKVDGRFFMMGILSWLMIKIRLWPFKKYLRLNIPIPLPVNVRWRRFDNYNLKSYAYTDLTDMYGRPKKIVQLGADKTEVSNNIFNYVGKNSTVTAYKGTDANIDNNDFVNPWNIKPGRMDQSWSEAHFIAESKISLIPWLLLLNAHTERNFAYTNMKYTYIPPVLKGVTQTNAIDGSINDSEYLSFDYLTGQSLETKNSDSYGNTKINRSIPAYWKYPAMGPVAENLNNLRPDNLNILSASTATYQYLNTVGNSNLLGASVTEWTKDSVKFTGSVRIQKKNIINATDYKYDYQVIGGDTLEKIYNTNGKTRSQAGTFTVVEMPIASAKAVVKPYKTYAYETGLQSTGVFTNFTPFAFKSAAQPNTSGWKLVNTNTLFDSYGNVVETKDILNKYATAYFGYNFSSTTAAVNNSTNAQNAMADAENIYAAGGKTVMDNHNIALLDAEITGSCPKKFVQKTLVYDNLKAGTKVVTLCIPAAPVFNKNIGKIEIGYASSAGALSRMLYMTLNENRDVKILTDKGEAFTGFYALPVPAASGCNSSMKLVFDKNLYTKFIYTALTGSSITSSYNSNEALESCTVANLAYDVPDNNCSEGFTHTGKNAFSLKAGGKGTQFSLNLTKLPLTEKGRSYKALVWVHNLSAQPCSLVVENAAGTVIKTKALSSPTMTAGNWSLLRLDVAPSEYGSTGVLRFYIRNGSTGGNCVYDDFRVLPAQATMEATIYDHATGRISAKLNNDNLATFFIYDSRGRIVEMKSEIENIGPKTLKKYVYNEQKIN
ncbi:MAG TPA: hypothetical protein VF691_23235 [Cytophagaceae bacterium]